MSFSVDPVPATTRPRVVRYYSESISVSVGEISFEKGTWMFHHHNASSGLTEAGRAEMKLLVGDTIALAKITERLTA